MSGWNLPPGVTERMLPGNRPEDEAEEAWWEAFYDRSREVMADEEFERLDSDGRLTRLIEIARDMGHDEGRKAEREDARIEAAFAQMGDE